MKIEIVKVKEEELNDVRKLWIDFSGMEDDELSVEEWEKEVKRGYYEIEELNEGVKLRVGWGDWEGVFVGV